MSHRAPLGTVLTLFVFALALSGCSAKSERSGPPPTEGDAGAGGGDGGGDDGSTGAHRTGRCAAMMDSDGDGLFDEFEGRDDFDGDGAANRDDTDSDGDGIPDAEEKGDLGGCDARDSDNDGQFDYLDRDSDNDGLSDGEEYERYDTDPYDEDTDGDGYTDTGEVVTDHDPNDAEDGLAANDFFVVLPYEGEAKERELAFGTEIRKADVFFMMDRTGSMIGEVENLKSGLRDLVERITETIPDVGAGFAGFEDFPVKGDCDYDYGFEDCDVKYAQEDDVPFELISEIETDLDTMLASVDRLDADGGGATWASSTEALYQAATGEGIEPWVEPQSCPSVPDEEGDRFGYPCFRPGALPIIVTMTDTSSRNGPRTEEDQDYKPEFFDEGPPPHEYEETLDALTGIGARTFGVVSGSEVDFPTAADQFRQWATRTGTVDSSGEPIFFMTDDDGTALTDRIAEAIEELAGETPQDIHTRTLDGEDIPTHAPPVDATRFIKGIAPEKAFASDGTELDEMEVARDTSTFYGVTPGMTVEFGVRFRNDFHEGDDAAQVFRAQIMVVGNGVADLDSREVVIVVPPDDGPLI